MNSKAIETNHPSRTGRSYFIIWLALGAAGIFYIVVSLLAPEKLRGAETTALDVTNQEVATLSATVTDIGKRVDAADDRQKAMAGVIDTLRGDMSGLKTRFENFGESVTSRLSALEGQQPPGTQASAGAGQAAAPTMAISKKSPPPAAPPIDGVVTPDDSAVPPEPTGDPGNQSQAAPAKPAKVAAASADGKPAAAAKPYAVDLATSTSTDALRQIWQLFRDQHPELMSGLSPRSVTAGSNVRLLAGPFASQTVAAAQCAKMRKAGITCTTTPMAGTPL